MRWQYRLVGRFGVLLPLAGDYFLAILFEFANHQALFLGFCLSATSIAISAVTLRERGQFNSSIANAIIGGAVIDDVLALLALSIGNQYIAGDVPVFDSLLLIKGIFLCWALIGQKPVCYLIRLINESDQRHKYTELAFIFAMMMAIMFAVIFLVSLGVLVDLSALDMPLDMQLAGFFISITLVALLTKRLDCGLPARLLGYSSRESLSIGLGMAPRGEVAMISALLGLITGLIEQPLYVTLVLMSVLTTLVIPLALRLLIISTPGNNECSTPGNNE